MAVSLVSTGVQFPDASIQTTAAGASAVTLISTLTTTGTTTVDIALTGSYKNYKIVGSNVFPSDSAQAVIQFYSTYDNFATVQEFNIGAGAGYAVFNSFNTFIGYNRIIAGNALQSGNGGVCFEMTLYNPKSTNRHKQMTCISGGITAIGAYTGATTGQSTATKYGTTDQINGIRFYMYYSGTISTAGTFSLYGYN